MPGWYEGRHFKTFALTGQCFSLQLLVVVLILYLSPPHQLGKWARCNFSCHKYFWRFVETVRWVRVFGENEKRHVAFYHVLVPPGHATSLIGEEKVGNQKNGPQATTGVGNGAQVQSMPNRATEAAQHGPGRG